MLSRRTGGCKGSADLGSGNVKAAARALHALAAGMHLSTSQIGQQRHDGLANFGSPAYGRADRTTSTPNHEPAAIHLLDRAQTSQLIQELRCRMHPAAEIAPGLLDPCSHSVS